MPIVIVRARNVGPSSTRQCPEDTHTRNEFGQGAAGTIREAVPEEAEGESRPRTDGNEDLEDGSFGVTVADGRADGGKPLDGVAEVLVLDDFVVVQPHADDEGAEEGSICGGRVGVGDPLSGNLRRARVRYSDRYSWGS